MNRKSKIIIAFALVPILAASLTVGGRYSWDHWLESLPRLECPRTLDLGEKERGVIVIGRFHIRNRGRGTLTADNFSTSCSCAGVEREADGKLLRVQSIQLSPGEEINLLVRVGVTARPGENQLVNVFFVTNDPDHPKWQMDVMIRRVGGGYIAEPTAVVFGTFISRNKPSQIINLYDNGKDGCTVEEVRATHPEYFSATILPLPKEDIHEVQGAMGKLFARIKITAHSELPGRIDGELRVSLKGEKGPALPIPVLGEVLGLAETRPSILVLPRYVGNQSVHKGEFLIFNRREDPIEVVVGLIPPEITALLQDIPGHPDQRLLKTEWSPDLKRKQKSMSEVRIPLRVRSQNKEMNLEVPVLLTEDRSS